MSWPTLSSCQLFFFNHTCLDKLNHIIVRPDDNEDWVQSHFQILHWILLNLRTRTLPHKILRISVRILIIFLRTNATNLFLPLSIQLSIQLHNLSYMIRHLKFLQIYLIIIWIQIQELSPYKFPTLIQIPIPIFLKTSHLSNHTTIHLHFRQDQPH